MWACLFQKATKPEKATTKPSALRATGMEELAGAYVFRAYMDPKVRADDLRVVVRTHRDGTRTFIISSDGCASRRHSLVRVACKYPLPDDADVRSPTASLTTAIYTCGMVTVIVPKF